MKNSIKLVMIMLLLISNIISQDKGNGFGFTFNGGSSFMNLMMGEGNTTPTVYYIYNLSNATIEPSLGYFSSTSFAGITNEILDFIVREGRIQLITSPFISTYDRQIIKDSIENREKDLIHKKSELETIIKENQKEEKSLNEEADKAKGKIEERILFAYNKIRNTYKNGLAIVAYDRDSCGGCFNKIPPQRQLEIRQRTKIIVCEHCGRVLVDPELKPAT